HEKPDAEARARAVLASGETPAELEKKKIRGAVRTDFILSAEIIVLSLAVVANEPLLTRATSLAIIALAVTVVIYGLVAAIVKMDDAGLWLDKRPGVLMPAVGRALLYTAPWLMKALGIVGTIAMFLVGGGIFVHNIDAMHHLLDTMQGWGLPAFVADILASLVVGIIVGAIVAGAMSLFHRVRGKSPAAAH
ncbi:MAG TPA: DUF808 family protein, partial [Lysobacter sp.]|nr:DUF808 family protein [Lysobacter sp.]